MYSDESEHSESEFYYPDENIPSTTKWVFKPNTDENTSVSVYFVVRAQFFGKAQVTALCPVVIGFRSGDR